LKRGGKPSALRHRTENKQMDPINIIAGTSALAAIIGLAFMSGHEYGRKAGITTERKLADHRVSALLERENRRAPRRRNRK
jgi:hypothetical protein